MIPSFQMGCIAAAIARFPGHDPSFANVSLLLKGEGAPGGTTITDSSSNALVPTQVGALGNVTTSTTAKKYQTSSLRFGGGQGLQYATTALFAVASVDWTLEFYINPDGNAPAGADQHVFQFFGGTVNTRLVVAIQANTTKLVVWTINSGTTGTSLPATVSLPIGVFTHVAIIRKGTNLFLYIAGTLISVGPVSQFPAGTTLGLAIGVQNFSGPNNQSFVGYLDEVRFTKNVVRYSPTIPVPTALLPDTLGGDSSYNSVSLLLHGNGANNGTVITDSSSFARSVTITGNTCTKTAQSKFGGSSLAFDGVGDRLTYAASAGFNLGDTFTIEFWMYALALPTTGNYLRLFLFGANGSTSALTLQVYSDGTMYLGVPTGAASIINSGAGAVVTNQWNHYSISINAGRGVLFKNGALLGATDGSVTQAASASEVLYIGYDTVATVDAQYNGYLQDLRITKGVSRRPGTIPVPTGPFPTST